MSEQAAATGATGLLELYDTSVGDVYGYLVTRCGQRMVAEDLTAETFLAAADAVRREHAVTMSVPWLIGVARHKLIDHWRSQSREERTLRAVGDEPATEDPWDEHLDAVRARDTLAALAPQHRAALTLRYLDDLSVPEVAEHLQRTVHATEALLVRARTAFRRAYTREETGDA